MGGFHYGVSIILHGFDCPAFWPGSGLWRVSLVLYFAAYLGFLFRLRTGSGNGSGAFWHRLLGDGEQLVGWLHRWGHFRRSVVPVLFHRRGPAGWLVWLRPGGWPANLHRPGFWLPGLVDWPGRRHSCSRAGAVLQ